jgi:predicted acetyltransferase
MIRRSPISHAPFQCLVHDLLPIPAGWPATLANENLLIRFRRPGRDKNSIMADPYPIRPVTEDELLSFRTVMHHAFHGGPDDRPDPDYRRRLFEIDRSLAAFDSALPGGGPVGTAGVYSFGMAVPGAVLPTAGVTVVSVLPTHRRRGILRSLMRRQLTDIAARGEEPIAALWASETPIYGRYGYGRAASHASFRFGRAEGALAGWPPSDQALTLRLADPQAVVGELAKVYDGVLPGQPGFFTRSGDWWERILDEPSGGRHGGSPLRCLLAEDGSVVRGYALYRGFGRWDSGNLAASSLDVFELMATDHTAGAALWGDLLSRDLLSEITADLRPVDDPLLYQLVDARRARPQVTDNLWVRIIDLPSALARRAYAVPVDVVLEVSDTLLPGNAGRWWLHSTGPDGPVSCERTTVEADIALDVRDVGAVYLGGTRLGALAAAGRVRELRPGTLRPLSAALSWDPAPWCPRIF